MPRLFAAVDEHAAVVAVVGHVPVVAAVEQPVVDNAVAGSAHKLPLPTKVYLQTDMTCCRTADEIGR